ncbi:uncharacterized protein ACR2FA_012594 [Aphomia sociella]
MHITKERLLPQAKSYSSIFDIIASTPYNNVFYKNSKRVNRDVSVFQVTCGDTANGKFNSSSEILNQTLFVTSEKYHELNKNSTHKSITHSTSTIFYDLDDIVKRHSFNCIYELTSSKANVLKVINMSLNQNGFKGKSNVVVQECATQIHPKVIPKDSIEINSKKIKKSFPNDGEMSSEIYLRNDYADDNQEINNYYDREFNNRHQKFWSYAKYRTEYTNPKSEEKKHKKKDRGKHREDPCPCQLFSYACPCTDKKSLTELAQNSKTFTVANQVTSTTRIISGDEKELKISKIQNNKNKTVRKDKPTNMSNNEFNSYEATTSRNEPTIKISDYEDNLTIKDVQSKSECIYRSSPRRNKTVDNDDTCEHEPRCELVPICQILPIDNIYDNHNIKKSSPRSTPRVIRITKGCRHHPPCTVVPSCQRANVLKNNCEYIPPCLHRPRCVNLPLCVPFSKSLHYDEIARQVDDTDKNECLHYTKCKYIPEYQQDINNNMENPISVVSHVQNACEFLNNYHSPQYIIHSKSKCLTNTFSPYQILSPDPCNCCKSNKSCQYDCLDCKCDMTNTAKIYGSSEAVIFIRDVGCQFRNKKYSPRDSILQSKHSSASFDSTDMKMGDYYANVRTLRYEDKFTNPISHAIVSVSTLSVTSVEIDTRCPTHAMSTNLNHRETTGFDPKPAKSPFIAAFTTHTAMLNPRIPVQNNKSHRSFFKEKYKKIFSVKRRRRSRAIFAPYNRA